MDYMLMPLRRYADFSGRSRRKEYWMFLLFYILVACALSFVAVILGGVGNAETGNPLLFGLLGLLILALIIPSIAVQVRRFHDQDKSGWFVLLNFVPYVGGLIVFVFMCLEGTKGDNRYGPDPKGSRPEELADLFR